MAVGYSWSDGTPLSHTNWGHGEPNNHEGREECVEMVSSVNGSRSWWNDLNCDAHQDWICMITKGKNPVLPPVPPPPIPGKLFPQEVMSVKPSIHIVYITQNRCLISSHLLI